MRPRLIETIIFLTLIIIICFFCLATLIESSYDFLIPGWTKYLIAIPFTFCLLVLTKWTKRNIVRKVILTAAILIIIFSRSISDRLFLGQQIAYTYLGQDAGFEELYLFSNGKCKLTYGNIFGVIQNHYGTYGIKDTTVFVETKAQLLDLELYTINLGNKTLTIQRLQ
jgi:hypothetical protein